MDATQAKEIHECARGSQNGALTFPEIVSKLIAAGVERYHADYCRGEITYFGRNGDSHVEHFPPAP